MKWSTRLKLRLAKKYFCLIGKYKKRLDETISTMTWEEVELFSDYMWATGNQDMLKKK